MELTEILNERWSCRGFLPDQVPEETLREIFALAQRTASWCNTQPWQVQVLSGDLRDRLAKELVEAVMRGEGGNDLDMPERYVGVYKERQREAGFGLYGALGIAREDKAARAEQMLKNFTFFDAPHVAIVTTDVNQGLYGAADCGAYVANLLNIAHAAGVATIPQAAIAMQSPTVRRVLDLPEERRIFCGISIGYADPEHPANAFRTSRAPADDAVEFRA
ncbi:nitroreductase [Nocardioides daedukensis]|uniref:Nitroreductase n=1 Tax=Nocardioides daedukensis TaxID=634462 RepID=A0A7Y9S4H6_9ACTN|nr:nitroreductase [Nocardioides daedukensis]NYG59868.1 nitroreductase [Nocardioides daedukensis]